MQAQLNYPRSSTIYKITGTKIFRLGSAMILSKYGENTQNKDKAIRYVYCSDGYELTQRTKEKLHEYLLTDNISQFSEEELKSIKIMVQVDESGADALIVAYLCRAGKFRDLFIYGVKPHIYVALHVFANVWKERCKELDIDKFLHAKPSELKSISGFESLRKLIASSDEWAAHERFYYIAKMICHAANYGMKGPTFALNVLQKSEGSIRLSVEQATLYLNTYHRTFPEIQQWHSEVVYTAQKQNNVLYNLYGEPRLFAGLWSEEVNREMYAFIPASTVGQIINKAKTRIQMDLIETGELLDTDLLQNGHDSILAQTLITQERFVAKTIQHYVNAPLVNFRGEKFSMKSESQIGANWGPQKYNNPLGLRNI